MGLTFLARLDATLTSNAARSIDVEFEPEHYARLPLGGIARSIDASALEFRHGDTLTPESCGAANLAESIAQWRPR